MTHKQLVRDVLDKLAKEHGAETFVSDGYGYYEDAEALFGSLLCEVEEQAVERIVDLLRNEMVHIVRQTVQEPKDE